MSVILFKKAKANLDVALAHVDDPDDYILQLVANNVQQCLEKILKYALEQYGVNHPKTHSISVLLQCFPADQELLSSEDLEFLEVRLDSLRLWESEVRYDTDYMATRRQVISVLTYARRLYDRVDVWVRDRCEASKFQSQETSNYLERMKLGD